MLKDLVEINIPTYNRAKYLEHTLSKLLDSPFKDCLITIRDNCSQDNTSKVCRKYAELFPNMKIIRNRANIGGDANIIRCYERATHKYNWVLGDDDELDFSNCEDVIEKIKSEQYDLILICSPGFPYNNWNTINDALKEKTQQNNFYSETNGQNLVKTLGISYFFSLGFISAYIYKSKLFDSECLIKGYDNVKNMMPHYPFIIKSIEENFTIYKSKSDIITIEDNDNEWDKSIFYWVITWLESSLLIKDKDLRKIASQFLEGGAFKVSLGTVIKAKAFEEEDYKNKLISLTSIMIKLNGWFKGGIYSILILLASKIPKSICLKIYSKYKNNN